MGYRPDGLRAWKQVNNGPRTYFFYDGERLSMEIVQGVGQEENAAVVSRAYGWGAAGLEQVDYANSSPEYTLFYAFDPQGNVASRVLNRGAALDQVFYDAFGKVVGDWAYDGSGSWLGGQDAVGWGGQWGAYTDVESFASGQMGLVLLTHRYYNPDTGRFLTRDPMGYEGGVNLYAYTRNNPVNRSDPSGYDWDDIRAFLGIPSGDWCRGAAKEVGNSFVSQIFGVGQLQQLGLIPREIFAINRAYEGSGADDMHNYLGIAMVMSNQLEFDFSAVLPAVSSKLSKTPESGQLSLFPVEPFNRLKHYGRTPTAQQKASVPPGHLFDHDPPLAIHYYEGDGKGGVPGYMMTQAEREAYGKSIAAGKAAPREQRFAQGGTVKAAAMAWRKVWFGF